MMEIVLLEILETVTIAISGFLIKKYVFLEPDMEGRKQRIYYGISFFLIGIVFVLSGKDAASLAALLLIGFNICLGRQNHRLRGLVLMIPFPGIINGLLVPPLLVPPYLFALNERSTWIYQFAVYGVLTVLLLLFLVKGKNWRNWFQENMQHRSLRNSEKYLLWVIGILMLLFANHTTMQITLDGGNVRAADSMYGRGLAVFIGITSASAFVMTITIIMLIMQGNKRSFYHERISGMQSGMITLMAEIVENRDDNTGGHIRRTAKYVEMIAEELKERGAYPAVLTDEYVKEMVVAAPLHDIGKIHIPDSILNKPGRLTEEEFAIMKTHTTAGRDLLVQATAELGEFSYLHMATEMAESHHEWWNGKGYPAGICGEEIPLCARIMAVADVFDALTSRRCYKDEMPLEKAYAIIREESGTHFDPVVAEAFLAKIAVDRRRQLQ